MLVTLEQAARRGGAGRAAVITGRRRGRGRTDPHFPFLPVGRVGLGAAGRGRARCGDNQALHQQAGVGLEAPEPAKQLPPITEGDSTRPGMEARGPARLCFECTLPYPYRRAARCAVQAYLALCLPSPTRAFLGAHGGLCDTFCPGVYTALRVRVWLSARAVWPQAPPRVRDVRAALHCAAGRRAAAALAVCNSAPPCAAPGLHS